MRHSSLQTTLAEDKGNNSQDHCLTISWSRTLFLPLIWSLLWPWDLEEDAQSRNLRLWSDFYQWSNSSFVAFPTGDQGLVLQKVVAEYGSNLGERKQEFFHSLKAIMWGLHHWWQAVIWSFSHRRTESCHVFVSESLKPLCSQLSIPCANTSIKHPHQNYRIIEWFLLEEAFESHLVLTP